MFFSNNNEHVATSLLSRIKKGKNDSFNKNLVSKYFLIVFLCPQFVVFG